MDDEPEVKRSYMEAMENLGVRRLLAKDRSVPEVDGNGCTRTNKGASSGQAWTSDKRATQKWKIKKGIELLNESIYRFFFFPLT